MSQRNRPWKVLTEKNFGFFWVTLLVSSIGNQLSHVAIGWQIYELTSSPLQLGLTWVFRALPVVAFSLTGVASGDILA
ncbi:MAG TPA: MFS transporter [Candidatus Binatia bacterium]|nr:MFS transporter [Candidatus Binatia bacterium]